MVSSDSVAPSRVMGIDIVDVLDDGHHLLVEHCQLEGVDRGPGWIEALQVL